MILSDAAKEAGVAPSTITFRIEHGWAEVDLLKSSQKDAQGEECSWAKLTNAQARYVRDNPDNLTQKQLAEMFNMDRRTIGDIQRGETYKHVGGTLRKAQHRTYLTDKDRVEVCRLYATGNYTMKQLAGLFGCSATTICDTIHRGKNNDTTSKETETLPRGAGTVCESTFAGDASRVAGASS